MKKYYKLISFDEEDSFHGTKITEPLIFCARPHSSPFPSGYSRAGGAITVVEGSFFDKVDNKTIGPGDDSFFYKVEYEELSNYTKPKRTIKEYHKLHKELWQWLINNPLKEKSAWPRWKENGGDIESSEWNCFACDEIEGPCTQGYECMFTWPFKRCRNITRDGLYDKFMDVELGSPGRWHYTKSIRNLKTPR